MFGLWPDVPAESRHSPTVEDLFVHRRQFLRAAGLTGATLLPVVADVRSADNYKGGMTEQITGAVLKPTEHPSMNLRDLTFAVSRAEADYTDCRYARLVDSLPTLIPAAEATAADLPGRDSARLLAVTYQVATKALFKTAHSSIEWLAAERAVRAANESDDPLVAAESKRLFAAVARREGRHEHALELTLAAADHLDPTGAPSHTVGWGRLYCSAAYAAAKAGDRQRAQELIVEANSVVDRLAGHPQRMLLATLVSHRVSVAYELGDSGAALAHASALPLEVIPTIERRARLLIDTAMAYAQWGKPQQAYTALITAERMAPDEVRTRDAARRLVSQLMNMPGPQRPKGLSALGARIQAEQ